MRVLKDVKYHSSAKNMIENNNERVGGPFSSFRDPSMPSIGVFNATFDDLSPILEIVN